MNTPDTGKDKIKKICEILKNETLEPAKKEAQKIIEVAQAQAHEVMRAAEEKAEQLLESARAKNEKERQLFESSLSNACKQGVESLKQAIETKFFNGELSAWVQKHAATPDVAAKLITALVGAIEKEGTSADFSAIIPKTLTPDQVNGQLGKEVLEKLSQKSVDLGDFLGGVKLSLKDKRLTLDLSDQALKELLGRFIRKDFRAILFQD